MGTEESNIFNKLSWWKGKEIKGNKIEFGGTPFVNPKQIVESFVAYHFDENEAQGISFQG